LTRFYGSRASASDLVQLLDVFLGNFEEIHSMAGGIVRVRGLRFDKILRRFIGVLLILFFLLGSRNSRGGVSTSS
jgi:hypothetical protein